MMIKARLLRLSPVFFLPVSRQGDEHGWVRSRFGTQAAGDFVAIHSGKPNVKQTNLRLRESGHLKGMDSVKGDLRFMPFKFNEQGQALSRVRVIVYDKDTIMTGRFRLFRLAFLVQQTRAFV